MQTNTALIIGAGPAGLTAAYELLRRGGPAPCILEATQHIGGLARTECFAGNRIDIGGHRFFSKSDTVMNWWQELFPLCPPEGNPPHDKRCLLVRARKSSIYWDGKLFDYPVSLSVDTLRKLGPAKIIRAGFDYLHSALFPRKPEKSLEDFFVNRFGYELYATFFRDYTLKVWGIPCNQLSPDWGAQRVKGLSLLGVLLHALKPAQTEIGQKRVETSLIGRFLYPPYGPGQLWEHVAGQITARGGSLHMGHTLVEMKTRKGRVITAVSRAEDGALHEWRPDCVFSSMPVRDLARALGGALSDGARELAESLRYRDFFTIGLLLDKIELREHNNGPLQDNWIYVHDARVHVGRVQFFKNWSPWMVKDPETAWVGLEYFCNETDALWNRPEKELVRLAAEELEILGIARRAAVRGGCRIRAPKAYPVYMGKGYEQFQTIRQEIDSVENLYTIGRNGMHRYNNMDHSMLSAMEAVRAACDSTGDKESIWRVNAETDYHEIKKTVGRRQDA